MKILSVRGQNLNSLREFHLPLDAPPLSQAGLVVITGPTGAGKSTLLDAIGLALYGRTPRLTGSALGDAMTHGTRETWVEVEVESRGRRFRSRWSRTRSRNGTLQPSAMKLEDLDKGVTLAEKVTDVPPLVQSLLGLSWEEFCRAVLLAQGDFAAFLKANASDRTYLLERLTGATLYRRLSVLAFERAREARQRESDLQLRLDGFRTLDPEARARLVEDLARAEADREALAPRVKAAGDAWDWFVADEGLAAAVQDAQDQLTAAQGHLASLSPLKTEVEGAFRAEPLRADLDRVRSDTQSIQGLKAQRDGASRRAMELEGRAADAARVQQGAQEELRGADTARADAEPRLRAAADLDVELALRRTEAADAEKRAKDAQHQVQERQGVMTGLKSALEQAERTLTRESSWLEAYGALEEIRASLPDLRERLDEWKASQETLKLRARERDMGLQAVQRAQQGHTRAVQDLEGSRLARESAVQALEQARGALRVHLGDGDLSRLRSQLDQARLAVASLERMDQARAHLDARATEASEAQKALEEMEGRRAQDQEARELAARELAAEEAEQGLREQVVRGIEAQRTLASHRADLVEGQPCPLCGSPAHPWALDLPPDARVLDQARQELQAVRGRRDRLLGRVRGLDGQISTLARELEGQASRVAAATRALLAAQGAMDEARGRVPPQAPSLQDARQRAQDLESSVQVADTLHTRATRAEAALAARELELTRAEGEVTRLQAHLDHARVTLQGLEKEVTRAREESAIAAASLTLKIQGVETPALREPADADAVRQVLERKVAEWVSHKAARDTAAADVMKRSQDLEKEDLRLGVARGEALTATEALKEVRTALLDLEARRRGVLEGEVDPVRRSLDRRVSMAREALSRAVDERSRVDQELLSARQRAQDLVDRVLQEEEALGERTRNLEMRALEAGFESVESLRFGLRDAPWRESSTRRLAQAADQVARARTVREERLNHRDRHGQDRPPDLANREEALARRDLLNQENNRLGDLCGALKERIANDDQALQQSAQLRQERETLRALSLRARDLSDLIGSASGDAFQRFAQGLTLEHLLRRANGHLLRLRPRYALERRMDKDLAFQVVDRHMADEKRGIETLSGGETFLASLALALGLSDIARGRVSIGSLFLDEGFGTLDPDSLDVALAALDALQAEGRQVFLVSHVEALRERLPVRIEVIPVGGGHSRVVVP